MKGREDEMSEMYHCPNCRKATDTSQILVMNGIDDVLTVKCACGWADTPLGVPAPTNCFVDFSMSNGTSIRCVAIVRDGIRVGVGAIYGLEKNIHEWRAFQVHGSSVTAFRFDTSKISVIQTTSKTETDFHGWLVGFGGLGMFKLGADSDTVTTGSTESQDIFSVLTVELDDGSIRQLKWDAVVSWSGRLMDAEKQIREYVDFTPKWLYVCPACGNRHLNADNCDAVRLVCGGCSETFLGSEMRPSLVVPPFVDKAVRQLMGATRDKNKPLAGWATYAAVSCWICAFLCLIWPAMPIIAFLFFCAGLTVLGLFPQNYIKNNQSSMDCSNFRKARSELESIRASNAILSNDLKPVSRLAQRILKDRPKGNTHTNMSTRGWMDIWNQWEVLHMVYPSEAAFGEI
jgi:ribosomal protein L37AE/L43A